MDDEREKVMNIFGEDAGADGATMSNLEVLKDIELPVSLRFGRTRMTLQELVRLSAGSVIQLDGLPSDPVELLVNGRVVARGEAVIVQNSYGIRISEISGEQKSASPLVALGAPTADAEGGLV